MNKFFKVSQEEYVESRLSEYKNLRYTDKEIKIIVSAALEDYIKIVVPKRKTKLSAGYDFFSPVSFSLPPGENIKIATGIKCQLDEDKFLALVPRSSLGFKYRLRLDNTIGIVDADYFDNRDNEGHIFIKITNEGDTPLFVDKGESFAQGIIQKFYVTEDDESTEDRIGGIGSTGK